METLLTPAEISLFWFLLPFVLIHAGVFLFLVGVLKWKPGNNRLVGKRDYRGRDKEGRLK